MELYNRSMSYWRANLMDLAWLLLNSIFLFRSSNIWCSTKSIGLVTPQILTDYLGNGLNFLGLVNDDGLLWY